MGKYLLPGFLALADIITLIFVMFLSLYIRFDFEIVNQYLAQSVMALPLFILFYLLMLKIFHMYNRIWRYAGMRELLGILAAATSGALLFWGASWQTGIHLPRSIYVITYILATSLIGLERLVLHYLVATADRRHAKESSARSPVLIIGAGDAGAIIAREIVRFHTQKRKLVGFVDDDKNKQGHWLGGFRVLGGSRDIERIVNEYKVEEIIIAIPSAKPYIIRKFVNICTPLKCRISILPGLYQLLDKEVSVQRLRPVSIEDLLERDEVHLDSRKVKECLEGKCVLVSGAGGSIGSEICRQIMHMHPSRLVLMGHGENSIYLIHQELSRLYGREKLSPVIASIRDKKQMEHVFSHYRPQVIFHAAAHKHVPMMEIQPMAAVLNNIYGTKNIAETAGEFGAERFVMISTDKAVNPTSVMGATKQVAERIVRCCNNKYPTKYMTVRFGNVLGSRGSVVPLFKKQLAEGGPLTVTDPEMIRYFMTIPEASQLVLQAGSMGNGGELFLLDMGKPVKIMDLARNMIRLSGYEPDADIKIKITGLRPGEKLYEEPLTEGEDATKTDHEKIFIAKPKQIDPKELGRQIAEFQTCKNGEEVIRVLQEIIPDYHPNHSAVRDNY